VFHQVGFYSLSSTPRTAADSARDGGFRSCNGFFNASAT